MKKLELVKNSTIIGEHGAVKELWQLVEIDTLAPSETIQCTFSRFFDPIAGAFGGAEYVVEDRVNKELSFSIKELLHMQEIAENLKENHADLRAISDIWNQTKTSGRVKTFPFAKVLN